MVKKEKVQFSVKLQGEKRKIEALKKHYDIKSDIELIRVLVEEKAHQLNTDTMEATTNANK